MFFVIEKLNCFVFFVNVTRLTFLIKYFVNFKF